MNNPLLSRDGLMEGAMLAVKRGYTFTQFSASVHTVLKNKLTRSQVKNHLIREGIYLAFPEVYRDKFIENGKEK